MEYDLLDSSVIQTILSEIENSEEIDRKIYSWDNYQIFSGNQEAYVLEELRAKRPKSYKSYTVSNISVSSMVVNKLAKSYKEAPKRILPTEQKADSYEMLLKEAGAERQLKEFDCYYNLHRDALFWVNYRAKEQRYFFQALQQHEYSLIRNKDTGDLECVILSYPDTTITGANAYTGGDGESNLLAEQQADGGGQTKVYAMWTKEQHVVIKVVTEYLQTRSGTQVKKSIEYVPIEGNPRNINFLGIIPFVYKSKSTSPEYPTPNPIKNQTVTFNALFSELLTTANIQGAGILKFKYPEKMQGQFDQMHHGLTTALELPQSSRPDDAPTEAEYISPSPALEAQKDVYLSYLKQVLAEHGITTSQNLEMQNFSSGIERLISQADVQSIISENQNCYTELEEEIFEIVKRWDEFLGQRKFSREDELQVIYPKPKVLISDKETLETIEKRLSLGLIEKWEALVMLDPNMSEKDAREKLDRIQSERQSNMEQFIGRQMDIQSEARPFEDQEQEGS